MKLEFAYPRVCDSHKTTGKTTEGTLVQLNGCERAVEVGKHSTGS